jgi:hypothetical protein
MILRQLSLLLVLLVVVVLVTIVTISFRSLHQELVLANKNLVIYAFNNKDIESATNLAFFVAEGVLKDSNSSFVILLQQNETSLVRSSSNHVQILNADATRRTHPQRLELPALPKNAQYVRHEQRGCRGLGTIAWYLLSHYDSIKKFQYFIIIDSSVRGPFLPTYANAQVNSTQTVVDQICNSVNPTYSPGCNIHTVRDTVQWAL